MPATVGGGWLIALAGLALHRGHGLAAGGDWLSHRRQTSESAGHGNEPGKRRGPAGRPMNEPVERELVAALNYCPPQAESPTRRITSR
jgi:hypothetical protein